MEIDPRIKRLIRHKTRQMIGKAGLTASDLEDIEEDLVLDLLERLPRYDPAKSSEYTFALRVVEHRIARILARRSAAMRDWRTQMRSLSEPVLDDEGRQTQLAETLPGPEGPAREALMDLADVLEQLPERLRALAKRLPETTIRQIAQELGVSRRTVHRWVGELRAHLEEKGFGRFF